MQLIFITQNKEDAAIVDRLVEKLFQYVGEDINTFRANESFVISLNIGEECHFYFDITHFLAGSIPQRILIKELCFKLFQRKIDPRPVQGFLINIWDQIVLPAKKVLPFKKIEPDKLRR